MNFVPNPGKPNRKDLETDMNAYFRRVMLRAHFGPNNNQDDEGLTSSGNSTWLPKETHHTVKTYIQKVRNDFDSYISTPNSSRPNLSPGEKEAMDDLAGRDDIIISKADKGGAVVIQDVDDYIQEANRQLGNSEFYRKVDRDLTKEHSDQVNETIKTFADQKLISEKAAKALRAENAKTPKFYMLPKVHKANHPGRPIIAAIDSPTSKLARFADHHLKPIAEQLPSYVKDTGSFLRKINKIGKVPKNSILVTMDVSSLYTNIPHREGLNAVARALEARTNRSVPTRVLLKFLSMILHLNNFCFNDTNYIQTKGCAMGSKCSGSYADIFMGDFEARHIYPRINGKHKAYTRFKDDIFLIWTGGEAALLDFFQEINAVHGSIKFECKHAKDIINFLDTNIHINPDGTLKTSLYRKPTDRNAYLHHSSYHPAKHITNIPYGHFLRARKICSDQTDADNAIADLERKFQERGFPQPSMEEQKTRSKEIPRATLLIDKEKTNIGRIPFSTTFNEMNPPVRKIINSHWSVLQTQNDLAETFKDRPVVAFRRNKNLRDILGQVHLSRGRKLVKNQRKPRHPGSKACLTTSRNQCCRHLQSTKTFKSDNTGETLEIRHDLNCRSKNTIYLGHCVLCPAKQYVGKSEPPANLRINTHRDNVNRPNGIAFDKHFLLPGHNFNDHARFTLIEQLKVNKSPLENRRRLEQREDYWMLRLKTLAPYGLNDHLNNNAHQRIHDICT